MLACRETHVGSYIGGLTPLRPTTMLGARMEPSACFFPATTKIFSPGLRSATAAGANITTSTFARDDEFLLAVFVLQDQFLTIAAGNRALDIGVGHGAVRHQVPRPMAFAGATQRLREDVDFNGLLRAVG